MKQDEQKKKENELVVRSLYDSAKAIAALKDESTVVEWAANTVMTTATEYTLAVDEVLSTNFQFSPTMIDDFHEYLRETLTALGQVHTYGAHPMTPKDMSVVGEIARAKYPYEKQQVLIKKLGIALPSPADNNIKLLTQET